MDIFKMLFKSKGQEAAFDIVESRMSVEEAKFNVMVIYQGRQIYVEDFFQTAKDLGFSRFFINREEPPRPHFAPSLDLALAWFRGRKLPKKDGYGSIAWGESLNCRCSFCGAGKSLPFRITKVERLVIYREFPDYREISGWRVVEVESEFIGKGVPTKFMDLHKTYATIKWDNHTQKYACQKCAARLKELGRQDELTDYLVC
jgi:hypothetical protein